MTGRRPGRRRALTASLVAALLLAASAAPSAATVAAADTDADRRANGEPAGDERPSEATPQVEDLTPWVPADGEFAVRVRLPADHPGGVLVARVHRPVESGEELRELDDPSRRTRWATYEEPVAEGATSVTVSIPVGEDDDGLDVGPGVYPVVLELFPDEGETWQAVTYLVHLPERLAPSSLALVVPVLAPLRWSPADGVTIDPASVEAIEALTATLAAYPEVPVTLALEPGVVTALGNVPGGEAVRDQLARIGRRGAVLQAPYAEVDAGAWAGGLLSPELVDQFAAGAATLTNLLGGPPDGATWVVDAGDSPALISWLAGRNVSRFLLTPHVPGGGLAGGTTPLRLEGIDAPHRAYAGAAVDAPLPATGDDPVLQANHLLAALVADSLWAASEAELEADEDEATPVAEVVAPQVLFAPGPTGGDLRTLTALLRALGEAGPLSPTTATALPTSSPHTVEVPRPPAPSGDLTELVDDLGRLRARVQSFAATAGQNDPAIAELRRSLLVAGRADLTHPDRAALLVEVEAVLREGLAGIELVDGGALTITSHRARLPVTLRNTSNRALDVAVTAESAELAMLGAPVRVTLQPGATEDLEIPFRVSRSGDFVVEVTVATPDGGFLLASRTVTLRSTAVSGLGVVLSVGALAFLAAWWARNLRRRRRELPPSVAAPTASAPSPRVSEPVP